tara:strand:- start:99 stop:329 length:231 start_codon:yes stop_codon:yes gene_type:complete
MASKKDYKHHMMYDPKTGKGRKTTSYEDHLSLKKRGWGHSKPNPLKKKVVSDYKKKKKSSKKKRKSTPSKSSGYGY